MLRLEIPVGLVNADYEVVVVLQPKPEPSVVVPASSGWPPGFIEQTAGAWQGELVRGPQGEYEVREDL
ncbi:MAG: hypothetical protein NUV77_12360 [Thermoguttaceae bacterium]|nr:hypothetical protein [Thermoguttaceae bacterium]